MARLELIEVTKRFGAAPAVDRVSLSLPDGGFLAVLGPSGCGKTTLLRLIAGFERVDGGELRVDGDVFAGPGVHRPPERRRVGVVFQSYALWPHMTVAGNVAYPLRVEGVRGAERQRRLTAALTAVGIEALAERRPAELSGGQRQRVALARCLVMAPRLVLLDEPLANLDAHLRQQMQAELADFHAKTGATTLVVTHDQAEAMALADQIAVMDHGRIVQLATPRRLYECPATPMVAAFVGQGSVVAGTVLDGRDGVAEAVLFDQRVRLRAEGVRPGPAAIALRPENLALAAEGIAGRVDRVVYRGGETLVDVRPTADPSAVLRLLQRVAPRPGDEVKVAVLDGWVIPDGSPAPALRS